MPEFYKFLYKRKIESENESISDTDLKTHLETEVAFYNHYRDFITEKDKPNKCIYHKSGHWIAYVNNEIYDSYRTQIQLPATNSFCQSYAVYLAVYEGHITEFVRKRWVDNIQRMACLHVEFINSILKRNYQIYYDDFCDTFREINEITYSSLDPVDLGKLKKYLQEICSDRSVAHEFSTSKEYGPNF